MIRVQVTVSQGVKVPEIAGPVVRRVVRRTCQTHGSSTPAGEASVLDVSLVGPSRIQSLNRDYRGVDSPTDVLSFPMAEEDDFPGFDGPIYIGDVIVCPDQLPGDMSTLHGLAFMVCHGTLHLLGWKHDDDKAAQRMNEATEGILSNVLPPPL